MALVNILNVAVLDNPTSFTNPFQFEITFECIQELQDDLEWNVIYVGNAEDSSGDQTLEEVMVGPVPTGINRFVLQADAPNPALIANNDLLGVTVVLVTCAYMNNRFVQIGYYVNNEYTEEIDPENPPREIDISKITRNMLADQPRVTRFAIDWTGANNLTADNEVAIVEVDEEEPLDLQALSDGEEEDEDDDDDDEEGEVDLAMDEDDDDAELLDDEGEELDDEADPHGDGEALRTGTAEHPEAMHDVSMEIMNDDSNSMDVARILQQQH